MQTSTASNRSPVREPATLSLEEQLRAAVDLLEKIVADRSLLADIPETDRNRLLNAAGRVSRPDALGRRQLLKVVKRKKRAEKVERQESVLAATGIRKWSATGKDAGAGSNQTGSSRRSPGGFIRSPTRASGRNSITAPAWETSTETNASTW